MDRMNRMERNDRIYRMNRMNRIVGSRVPGFQFVYRITAQKRV